MGSLTLTAVFRDLDLRVATHQAIESYDKLKKQIEHLNLEAAEMRTSEYSVRPIHEYEKNKQVNKGFEARMGLEISTLALARIGEVIAIASRDGIQEIGELTTFLSPKKLHQEQFSCLQEAAENAKAKAEKLAGSLNARIGQVITIAEQNTVELPKRAWNEMQTIAASVQTKSIDAVPNVEAGKQIISVHVVAVFSLQ